MNTDHESTLDALYEAVLDGDRAAATQAVADGIAAGLAPHTLLDDAMLPAMGEVGCRFEQGDYFVPEMVLAARAMQEAMNVLKPHLRAGDVGQAGRVVIGTIEGDMHDVGKNLVIMMLDGAGFAVHDLGVDVKPACFVEAVQAQQPDIVALSALLNTTMPNMKKAVDALAEAGVRERVKVLVGGAPLSPSLAAALGADAYAPDAGAAVRVAQSLIDG